MRKYVLRWKSCSLASTRSPRRRASMPLGMMCKLDILWNLHMHSPNLLVLERFQESASEEHPVLMGRGTNHGLDEDNQRQACSRRSSFGKSCFLNVIRILRMGNFFRIRQDIFSPRPISNLPLIKSGSALCSSK